MAQTMTAARFVRGALVLAWGFTTTAQAQPSTLTLACKGTMNIGDEKQPISMGIILNFTERTVQGFTLPGKFDVPVRITAANDVTVTFEGSAMTLRVVETTISGSLDRVTGDLEATTIVRNTTTENLGSVTNYELQCRPTQRMF